MRSLGLYIRKVRKEAGMSQRELARRCGVTYQTAWYWEHDRKSPTYEKLWALANALAVNVNDLILYKIESEQK